MKMLSKNSDKAARLALLAISTFGAILISSCISEPLPRQVNRVNFGDKISMLGFIKYTNYEYEFIPNEKIIVDGEKLNDCVSVVPTMSVLNIIKNDNYNSVKVLINGSFHIYPNDFNLSNEELMSTNLNLYCPNSFVLHVDSVAKSE